MMQINNFPHNPNPGWSCPKCSRVHAPWVAMCTYCSPIQPVMVGTFTNTVTLPHIVPLATAAQGGPIGAYKGPDYSNHNYVGINDVTKEDGWDG